MYRHLGEWWNNAPLVQQSFRHRLDDVESLRRASQLLQATGLAYAVEANRRRFPQCTMVLPWQFGESCPNAWCTSAVDYRGEPKPAYHAVARAFARRRVTVRVPTAVWAGEPALTAQAWVWDEDGTPPDSTVATRLRTATGDVLGELTWPVPEQVRAPRAVGTIAVGDAPRDAAVVWDMTWTGADGALLDREIVLTCTGADFAPLLHLAGATVDVRCDGDVVQVAHRGGPMVVGLQLVDDGPVDQPCRLVASGDPRPLLPGEDRTFVIHERAPAMLEAWNMPPTRISVGESQ